MTNPASQSHMPVMLAQSIEALQLRPELTWVDATAGGGGHLRAICNALNGSGTVIGIDRDIYSLNHLKTEFAEKATLVHANYSDITEVVSSLGLSTISGGILADLGVSSMQLDNPERGFSFSKDGPLDMRMDPTSSVTAEKLVNTLPENELANIIYKWGEERQSRRIARKIVAARPLHTTAQLASLIEQCVHRTSKDSSHPATRTFQALRIEVNDELANLEKFLHDSIKLLAPGARLVVITFHSLEDRLVKQIFRQAAASCICPPRQPVCTCHKNSELLIITRKPVVADTLEVLANPRSRSAKLRASIKLP